MATDTVLCFGKKLEQGYFAIKEAGAVLGFGYNKICGCELGKMFVLADGFANTASIDGDIDVPYLAARALVDMRIVHDNLPKKLITPVGDYNLNF